MWVPLVHGSICQHVLIKADGQTQLYFLDGGEEWDERFRLRWTDLLRQVGSRVADPGLDVEDARPELERLVADLSDEGLPRRHWPLYGALLTALGNVASIVDDVASGPVAAQRA